MGDPSVDGWWTKTPRCFDHPEGSPGTPPSWILPEQQDAISALEPDGVGGVWVAFQNRLRRLSAEGEWTEPPGGDPVPQLLPGADPFHDYLSPIRLSPSGHLWMGLCGGAGGLHRFDPETGGLESFPSPSEGLWCTRDIEFDGAGGIWAGILGGVARLTPESGEWFSVTEVPSQRLGFSAIQAREVLLDRSGVLWIAHNEGVSRVTRVGNPGSPFPFHHVTLIPGWSSSIAEPELFSVAPSADGGLWLGYQSQGLGLVDGMGREVARWTAEDSLSSNGVRGLARDRLGRLWAGTRSGIDLLEESTGRLVRIFPGPGLAGEVPERLPLNALVPSQSRDAVWVVTTAGLYLIHVNSTIEGPHRIERVVSTEDLGQIPLAVVENGESVWIGLYRGGAALLDRGEGRLWTPEELGTTSLGQVLDFSIAPDGTVWLAGAEALGRLRRDGDQWNLHHLSEEELGSTVSGVRGVALAESGEVWMTLRSEVLRFDPDSPPGNALRRFGAEAGTHRMLPYSDLRPVGDGWMMYASLDGAVAFHPDSVMGVGELPSVRVTGVDLYDRTLPITPDGAGPLTIAPYMAERLEFAPDQRTFRIQWSALDYSAPERNLFAYRVPELDERWIETGNRGEAAFTNMPAGEYTLEMAAANHDGVWNRQGASLILVVLPPWYATLWFRTLLLVSLAGIAATAYRTRVALLRRQRDRLQTEVAERTKELEAAMQVADKANRAKSIFLASMSHEIRTPMNAILGFSHLMERDRNLHPDHRDKVGTIVRAGEHLLKLINDVLEMSKIEAGKITYDPNAFELSEMVRDMENMFRMKTDERGIGFSVSIAENLPRSLRTDEGKVRQVLINVLGNAVKFTDEGGVDLRVSGEALGEGVRLSFEIEDTGPGIAPEEVEKVFAAFEQTESGRSSQQGTGLGMPISRQFARLMGGPDDLQ